MTRDKKDDSPRVGTMLVFVCIYFLLLKGREDMNLYDYLRLLVNGDLPIRG